MDVTRDRVLQALTQDPQRTIQIAQTILGKKVARCHMVNPILHQLQREGLAEKTSNSNGGNPHWSLITLIVHQEEGLVENGGNTRRHSK